MSTCWRAELHKDWTSPSSRECVNCKRRGLLDKTGAGVDGPQREHHSSARIRPLCSCIKKQAKCSAEATELSHGLVQIVQLIPHVFQGAGCYHCCVVPGCLHQETGVSEFASRRVFLRLEVGDEERTHRRHACCGVEWKALMTTNSEARV